MVVDKISRERKHVIMILCFMKIALQEHQNVSGQGIRSQCSDTHLAYGPTAPGTHIFVYFDNRQVSSGVSF